MIVKNVIIRYENEEIQVDLMDANSKNKNNKEEKLSQVIDDILTQTLSDESFIKTAMLFKM